MAGPNTPPLTHELRLMGDDQLLEATLDAFTGVAERVGPGHARVDPGDVLAQLLDRDYYLNVEAVRSEDDEEPAPVLPEHLLTLQALVGEVVNRAAKRLVPAPKATALEVDRA